MSLLHSDSFFHPSPFSSEQVKEEQVIWAMFIVALTVLLYAKLESFL